MSLSWDSLCRLCANVAEGASYPFSGDGEKKGIPHLVEKLLSVTISPDDSLPKGVCQECSKKIIDFNDFVVQCDIIQTFFRKYNSTNTLLQNDDQLRHLKSEFMCPETSIEIKKELSDEFRDEDNYDDFLDDEMDYRPLSDLIENKKTIPRLKIKTTKKKKGRPRKIKKIEKFEEEEEDRKVFTNINELLIDHKKEEIDLDDNHTNETVRDFEGIVVKKTKKGSHRRTKKLSDQWQYNIFKFTCHVCDKECTNWNALRIHCSKHHKCSPKVTCICLKQLSTRNSLLIHCAKHNPDKQFSCTNCDRKFGRKKDLDRHLLQHIPRSELPFVCCVCAKGFVSERMLKCHEKIHAPKEERYIWTCDLCGSNFSSKGGVKSHKRVVHEKLRLYICDLCGNSFSTKANMEEHRVRHMDAKDFVCSECNKSFKTKSSLVRHIDTHSGTAYQCPHCPMLLNSRRTLKNHLCVHNDTASHVCPFCDKAFKRRKECKSHMKLHTGERPYSCPWCPRTFTNGSNCRIHKRRMHPQEFAIAEMENPFAPTNAVKPEPKKIIHAPFRKYDFDKSSNIKDDTIPPLEPNEIEDKTLEETV